MHLEGDNEIGEKSPACASSNYPTLYFMLLDLKHQAYKCLASYSRRMQYMCGKLFDNSGYTFSYFFF